MVNRIALSTEKGKDEDSLTPLEPVRKGHDRGCVQVGVVCKVTVGESVGVDRFEREGVTPPGQDSSKPV